MAIATNLNQEIDFLKKKWRNLYDSFRKCEHRKKELTPSGAAASREPSFFKQLLFLKDVVSGKMTYTNVPTPRNVTMLTFLNPVTHNLLQESKRRERWMSKLTTLRY